MPLRIDITGQSAGDDRRNMSDPQAHGASITEESGGRVASTSFDLERAQLPADLVASRAGPVVQPPWTARVTHPILDGTQKADPGQLET